MASGTELKALATNSELLGTVEAKCEDSIMEGKATAGSSNPLPASLTNLQFGELPTPNLGEGCSGCHQVHVALPIAATVEMVNGKYFLAGTGKAHLLGCSFLNLTCAYEGKILAEITHSGKHPTTRAGENLAQVNISTPLTRLRQWLLR
jgi:hypothetical protein